MPAVCFDICAIHQPHPHHNQPDMYSISSFLSMQHGECVGESLTVHLQLAVIKIMLF